MLDIAEQGQIDSSTTIEEWLERIGFSEYIENFRAEGFDFAALQYGLDQEDLKALRITKKGHQKKLIFEVQQLISPSTKNNSYNHPLQVVCSQIISSTLSLSNVTQYLNLSIDVNQESSKQQCLEFIQSNVTQFFQLQHHLSLSLKAFESLLQLSILDIDEIILFQAILGWGHQGEKKDMSSLVSLIRLTHIAPQHLIQIVEPTGLISQNLLYYAYRFHSLPSNMIDTSIPSKEFYQRRGKSNDFQEPILVAKEIS